MQMQRQSTRAVVSQNTYFSGNFYGTHEFRSHRNRQTLRLLSGIRKNDQSKKKKSQVLQITWIRILKYDVCKKHEIHKVRKYLIVFLMHSITFHKRSFFLQLQIV